MVLEEGLPGEDDGGNEVEDGYDDGEGEAWIVGPDGFLAVCHCAVVRFGVARWYALEAM